MKLNAWIIVDKKGKPECTCGYYSVTDVDLRLRKATSVPCTITIPDPKTKKGKKK